MHSYVFLLAFFGALCGCQTLPDAHLSGCEDLDYNTFTSNFPFNIPDTLQYRYTLRQPNKKTLIANGINHRGNDGIIDIAGFTNVGMTLYSAQWQQGSFKTLKNNTQLSEKALERSILRDVLLVYRQLPANIECIRSDIKDNSLWLEETARDAAGCNRYFIVSNGQPGWGAIRDNKMFFKALVTQKEGNAPSQITIENFNEGYEGQIRFFYEDSSN